MACSNNWRWSLQRSLSWNSYSHIIKIMWFVVPLPCVYTPNMFLIRIIQVPWQLIFYYRGGTRFYVDKWAFWVSSCRNILQFRPERHVYHFACVVLDAWRTSLAIFAVTVSIDSGMSVLARVWLYCCDKISNSLYLFYLRESMAVTGNHWSVGLISCVVITSHGIPSKASGMLSLSIRECKQQKNSA